MALGADQALQPHEIVWALRRFVSSTGQESALPPYAPASRADTATRHRPRDDVGLVSWCRATPPLAAPAANLSRRFGTGLPERADRDPVCLCQLAGAALNTGQSTCCLQDSRGSSAACWPVLSLQVRSGGSSSQCAPVGPRSARWNDRKNDMPVAPPGSMRPRSSAWSTTHPAPRRRRAGVKEVTPAP